MAGILTPFQMYAGKSRERLDQQLITAVWQHRTREVRSLVRQGANPDVRRGPLERTVLMIACDQGNLEMAKVLLKAGAGADLPDNDMDTPLHMAAGRDTPELFDLLLKHGADLEAVNASQYTPLMKAAGEHKPENVRKLIALGADATAATKTGLTGLHLATISGDVETVTLLLENGADPEAATNRNITPLDLARKIKRPEVLAAYTAHFSLRHSRKLHGLRKNRPQAPKPE